MGKLDGAVRRLDALTVGKMGERLRYEIRYARRVSETLGGRHDALILRAIEAARYAAERAGVLTDAAAVEIENMLMPMQADCKKYTLIVCGHAHIDMNWMWRYDETVQITLDTFRTVLTLMREFPEFTFSQSQASVYRIVQEFDPDMLEEIKSRIHEGRWEVTASSWVEPDHNMGSAESMARHHLYTRAFFEDMGVRPVEIDFDPDTFGHHRNMPEFLQRAGIKYFYHCRGLDGQTLYRWRAPSGAEVLAYREPFWYNAAVDGDFAQYAPAFCERFGVKSALRVYGVGDHGGGPTRRDIMRLIDMQAWPIYADVRFGSFKAFFDSAAQATKQIPVVDHELNPLFTGCYTTQTRIKKGNRYGERLLGEAEALNAFAAQTVHVPYNAKKFAEGWRNVLFNQFHDILPGSGVPDTREYAMGLYQQSYAVANSARRAAMLALSKQIDTSGVAARPFDGDVSTGAGVGFGVEEGVIPALVEFGQGRTRIFHLFNACPFDRDEAVELIVWDLKAEEKRLTARTPEGESVPIQALESGHNAYWGHDYTRVMVKLNVPAMGYATCVIEPDEDAPEPIDFVSFEHTEPLENWCIENESLEVVCSPDADGVIHVTEKDSGELHIIEGFAHIIEDASRGMTAWVTGETIDWTQIGDIRVKRIAKGALYNALEVSADFGERSHISYTVSLRAGAKRVDIAAKVRWLETGDQQKQTVPQLCFDVMADENGTQEYVYDIPGGVLKRAADPREWPGIRFIADGRMMLMSDCKYGYHGDPADMGVTLIRGAYNPDEYPELGNHAFTLSVGFAESERAEDLTRMAAAFASPVTSITNTAHSGSLPVVHSFMRLERGSVEITSVKRAEDGRGLIIRGAELTGDGKNVCIALPGVQSARLTDTHEREDGAALAVENGVITFDARPCGLFAIRAEMA